MKKLNKAQLLKKGLLFGGIALGLALIIGLCIYYPVIEKSLRIIFAGQEPEIISTSQGLIVNAVAPPTPEYPVLEKKGIDGSIMYEDVQGSFKYTLKGFSTYPTLEEAGLNPEECVGLYPLEESPKEYSILLLDMEVENISATPREDMGDDINYPYILPLWADIRYGQGEDPQEYLQAAVETTYFSLHPPINSSAEETRNYYYFNVEKAEKKAFKMAVIVPNFALENKWLILYLGPTDEGKVFELFPNSVKEEGTE